MNLLKTGMSSLFVFLSAVACSSSKDSGGGTAGSAGTEGESRFSASALFDGLRDVTGGEIRCNADNCCFYRCWDKKVVCLSRDPKTLAEIVKSTSNIKSSGVVFPEWFYEKDCFVVVEVNGVFQGGAGDVHEGNDGLYYGPMVQCLCGRTGTTISGGTSSYLGFKWSASSKPMAVYSDVSDSRVEGLFSCGSSDTQCTSCSASCSGRKCGSDGCGGSCGTCASGETCSAAGVCTTSGSTDSCGGCLSDCHGLSSCCTGCGCLCESECGGCF